MRPHGTSSRYTNNGCRCQECWAAWATRMRAYYRERRAKYRATHPPKPRFRKIAEVEYPAILQRIRQGETLQEIGDDYGVTREAIRQIAAKTDSTVTAGRAQARAEIE